MNSRNKRFEYRLATYEDGQAILDILESDDFKGNISVLFTRRPNPYESFSSEGERIVLPVMIDNDTGKMCAMGCCVIRKAYINEEIKRVGYLTGFKILPEYRKGFRNISEVYGFIYEQTKNDVDIYYTTILKDNVAAQKLLEKDRKYMPKYRFLSEYTVYCIGTGNRISSCFNTDKYSFTKGKIDGLDGIYEKHLQKLNFSPLNMDFSGDGSKDIYTLRDSNGEILAACTIWNQQSYKQYIITGYGGIYKLIKNFPLKKFGYFNFPKENRPANYASITSLWVKDMNFKIAENFILMVAGAAVDFNFLMIGLVANHPLMRVFNKVKHIKYQSKLYSVHWRDDLEVLEDRAINIEVGLL